MKERIEVGPVKEFSKSPMAELRRLDYPYMQLEVGEAFRVSLEGFEDRVQHARQFIWMRKPKGTDRWWTSKLERPAEGAPVLHVIRLK